MFYSSSLKKLIKLGIVFFQERMEILLEFIKVLIVVLAVKIKSK